MIKKTVCIFCAIFSLYFIFADESILSMSGGVFSGGVIYSDSNINQINTDIGSPTPVNLGVNIYVNLNPAKTITFFAGTDCFYCMHIKNNQYINHLFINVPFGVKIYPNLKGFCISSAYVPGFRKDYIKADCYTGTSSNSISWSNGFKFSLEYNFAHNCKSKFLPTTGVSWTHMPRSNYNHDELLTIFVQANF